MKKLLLLPLLILLSLLSAYSYDINLQKFFHNDIDVDGYIGEFSIENFCIPVPDEIKSRLKSDPVTFDIAWKSTLKYKFAEFNKDSTLALPNKNLASATLSALNEEDLLLMAQYFENLSDTIFKSDIVNFVDNKGFWVTYHKAALLTSHYCQNDLRPYFKSSLNFAEKIFDSHTDESFVSIIHEIVSKMNVLNKEVRQSKNLDENQKSQIGNDYFYLWVKFKALEARMLQQSGKYQASIDVCDKMLPRIEEELGNGADIYQEFNDMLFIKHKNYSMLGDMENSRKSIVKLLNYRINLYEGYKEQDIDFKIIFLGNSLRKAIIENSPKVKLYADSLQQIVESGCKIHINILRNTYYWLSLYYDHIEDYNQALNMKLREFDVFKNNLLHSQREFYLYQTELAEAYSKAGYHREAVSYMEPALTFYWQRDMVDDANAMSNQYATTLKKYISYRLNDSLFDNKTQTLLRQISRHYTQQEKKLMTTGTAVEREQLWSTCRELFEETLHKAAWKMPSDSNNIYGFNAALLAKGFILYTDTELSRIITETGDKTLSDLFDNLSKLRVRIQQQHAINQSKRRENLAKLENTADSIERILLSKSSRFCNFSDNVVVDWKKVQSALTSTEAAIEFVTFHDIDGKTHYAAYVLRHDGVPVMEHLFKADQLPEKGVRSEITYPTAYTTNSLSKILWTPLMKHLNGVGKIYFSPAGELCNIAIESMPDNPINNITRLSSTRELILRNRYTSRKDNLKAAIFSDINYDTPIDAIIEDSYNHNLDPIERLKTQWTAPAPSIITDDETFEKLAHAQKEGEIIGDLFSKKEINYTLFSGNKASEAAFKALSGKAIDIIHICTHGKFFDSLDKNDINRFSFFRAGYKTQLLEDRAMSKHCLAMAGANQIIHYKDLQYPDKVDDGILTAREISALDFRDLDLVVLSACQTGLGDISGEGVFGLQRGFKKAGANGILMSLWEVDDTVTQMLMTKFYENYPKKMSKERALRNAQNFVRNYNVRTCANIRDTLYAHPRFWAGFVLLDGLSPR